MNPFIRPRFIRVGYDEEVGYTIDIETRNGTSIHLICGSVNNVVAMLQVNKVEHFDFKNSMIDHSDAFDQFRERSKQSGFVF